MTNEDPKILHELKFLEAYYGDFNFDSYKFFISIIETEISKNFAIEKYEQISKKYNNETIFLNDNEDIKKSLLEPIKQQYLNVQDNKFFQNTTFIINLHHEDEEQNRLMMTTLRGLTNHLVKKTAIKIHLLMKEQNIMNLLIGTDFWEFRTHTFKYSDKEVNSVKLMDELSNSLVVNEDKNSLNKKNKI